MASDVEQSRRVHEFLLSPHAWQNSSRVELKETHISWVYLTDRFVYKQKKPVKFEFLDFSTLEQRRHYCEQEIELNRRFSPEVYRGLVSVSVNKDGDYRLGATQGGGQVVEWLVKMVRLDETATLDSLVRSNSLSQSQLARLSQWLTEFYSTQAPAMLRSDDFQRTLRHHIQANRRDLLSCLPGSEPRVQFVTHAQLRCMFLESEYFSQRVADGRVVQGHGDLRPEHIYYHRGKPAVIDCIEFSEEYRTNDVVDELAFLSMECDRLGNRNVGRVLLSAYLAAGTDDARPFLTHFYKCYRACVRAKVTALRLAQRSPADGAEPPTTVHEYLDLAHDYAERFSPRLVIIVGGLSGTGKSTLARALSDALSAEILQTDLIRNELFPTGSSNGKYTLAGRERVYDVMIERIAAGLCLSPTVVLDGTFYSQQLRQRVVDTAKSLQARVLQVQCECSIQVATSRVANRIDVGRDASEATPSLLAEQKERYQAPLPDEPLLAIDTTEERADQSQEVLRFLREGCRGSHDQLENQS